MQLLRTILDITLCAFGRHRWSRKWHRPGVTAKECTRPGCNAELREVEWL